jgi:hypothetical protein
MGLCEDATVEVKLSDRKLVLTPAWPEYALEELVAGIPPKSPRGDRLERTVR